MAAKQKGKKRRETSTEGKGGAAKAMPQHPRQFKDTGEIETSERMIDQVIGQNEACEVVKKAAKQRRHVLLIGEPGTGKSMLGMALAEMLPKEKLVDIVAFPNQHDENLPLIRVMPAGQGRELVQRTRLTAKRLSFWQYLPLLIFLPLAFFIGPFQWWKSGAIDNVIFAAFIIGTFGLLMVMALGLGMGRRTEARVSAPKVIVDNFGKDHAPFHDATGAHAGALLGDVLHDPFQTGGLGTPAHERVVAGMIHKAHMGVLFIDEIATLNPMTQQELLTALQEGKYAITGQSERSAGAMVRTEMVPCSFILIAAGNVETVKQMHPALRSRIRGYGYEVFMRETMEDTPENRWKIAMLVSQEVRKDKKIPHFSAAAVEVITDEARRYANRKGHLTLRMRELGGLVRAAGDIAVDEGASRVEPQHIFKAKMLARTLEQQIADKFIERKKEYEVIITTGKRIGRVNGLAVIGDMHAFSGIILPIEAEVTPGGKESEFIATGKLGDIAKEAVTNVSAIIKRYFGEDIKGTYDVYVQFLQTYEGVEGDSASIAVATAIISALKKVPIRQDYAMTGSLSVRGEVLPVGGVSSKVEAAMDAGILHIMVPRANLKDIIIDKGKAERIRIIPVDTIEDVLKEALDWEGHADILDRILGKEPAPGRMGKPSSPAPAAPSPT